MNITKGFGLHAHPLFVRVPIVRIPLVAIGAIAMAGSAFVVALVAVGSNVRLLQISDSGAKVTWQRVHLDGQPAGPR